MINLTKTIKLIDLFIKIAKGEDTPEKIKFQGNIYSHNRDTGNSYYYCKENGKLLEDVFIFDELNNEIEVIEDTPKEDKKIEKLDVVLLGQCDNWLQPTIDTDEKIRAELNPYIIDVIKENTLVMQRKINEIIDKINRE